MKKRLFIGILTACMLLNGCGKNSTSDSTPASSSKDSTEEQILTPTENSPEFESTNTEIIEIDHSLNNIANIADYLYAKDDKNIILSETSLNMALGLLTSAASGDTRTELEKYLGADHETLLLRNNSLINQYNNMADIKLSLANSMWMNKGYEYKLTYYDILTRYYNALVDNTIDFSSPGASDKINKWCSDNTNGCIPTITDDATLSQSDVVLINALYFNGDWSEPFEEYLVNEDEFTNIDNSITKIDFMRSTENTYFENDMATGFAKNYKGGEISFIGILPKEEGDFNIADLDLDGLLDSKTNAYDVYIKMPKFKMEDSNSLFDALNNNGLDKVFSEPDFKELSDDDFEVSDILQKTYVDINETGTEAAAVTEVMMKATALAPEDMPETREVELTRSFVFMIYDNTNNECLFIGKITNMNDAK